MDGPSEPISLPPIDLIAYFRCIRCGIAELWLYQCEVECTLYINGKKILRPLCRNCANALRNTEE